MNTTPIDDDELKSQLQELMNLTERLDAPQVTRCDLCGSILDKEIVAESCASCS